MTEKIHVYMGGRGGGKAFKPKDTGFNEANVKRDEGGKFSAQQHQAAAQQHSATAAKHPDKQVAKAHADAAQAHTLAAQHIAAQTGWQEHNAQKAHNATKAAEQAEASAGGAANAEQLKAVAADPTKPLAARAEAVKQLEAMQAQADAVAASPLAVPQPGFAHAPGVKPLEGMAPPAKGNEVGANPELHKQAGAPVINPANIPPAMLAKLRKAAKARSAQAMKGLPEPAAAKPKSLAISPEMKQKLAGALAKPAHNPLYDKPQGTPAKQPSPAALKKHPQYNKEDHDYLAGKGWTRSQIIERWTAEHGKGQTPATGKVKAPDVVGVVSNPDFYKKGK